MKLTDTLESSIKTLGSNKARTVLTMLGVIIGVFAVVTLVALGKGVQNYITDQFNSLGTNVLVVAPGKVDFTGDPAQSFGNSKLEEKHINLINTYAGDYIEAVTPSYRIGKVVEYKNKNYYATFNGANENAAEKIFNIPLESGREFTKSEVSSKSKVAVIGKLVADEFFSNTNPLGKTITISGDRYEVIGVQAKKGQDFDELVRVPYTALEETANVDKFSGIAVKVKEEIPMSRGMKQVELALLRDLNEDEFSVLSPEDLLASFTSILGILTAALGGIAGISLLVGGIGIMNIMLVSVTERTKEIGLRKAVGATPFNIATQFLVEAVLISVAGGVIGLLFGFLAAYIAQQWVRAEVTLSAVLLAFGFSVLVGVVFGTYPAINAAKKDPIEALRYE